MKLTSRKLIFVLIKDIFHTISKMKIIFLWVKITLINLVSFISMFRNDLLNVFFLIPNIMLSLYMQIVNTIGICYSIWYIGCHLIHIFNQVVINNYYQSGNIIWHNMDSFSQSMHIHERTVSFYPGLFYWLHVICCPN